MTREQLLNLICDIHPCVDFNLFNIKNPVITTISSAIPISVIIINITPLHFTHH